MIPALINGKVVPSRIDAGRIRIEASAHLKRSTPPPPIAGSTESKAHPVAARNKRWKTSASTPMPSSAMAYPSSRLEMRWVKRLTSHDPSAMPPMKIASTSVCA